MARSQPRPGGAGKSVEGVADIATEVLDSPAGEPSLAGGDAGVALLFAYLAEALGSDTHGERAVRLVEDAMAMAVNTPRRPASTASWPPGPPGVAAA